MNKKILVIGLIMALVIIIGTYFFLNSNKNIEYNNSLLEIKIGDKFLLNNSNIEYIGQKESESKITSCTQIQEGYLCSFEIFIKIDGEASKRFAQITSDIEKDPAPSCIKLDSNGQISKMFLIEDGGKCPATERYYLNKNIKFFFDSSFIDEIRISEDLKGQEITQMKISASREGANIEEAYNHTEELFSKIKSIKID